MAAPPDQSLLDPQTLNTAEALGLQARYIVEGYMSGEHKSPFRGFSIEFTQHREYVPGDDVRHLDWKVLGRTDRYYLKQYEQETNFIAHILLDGSESMRYGSNRTMRRAKLAKGATPALVTKLQYGKMMAACLAYLILHQRDAVSLGLFDASLRHYSPRTGNLASIHNMMHTLHAFDPAGPTRIGAVLHEVAAQITRKGIVILISDLLDDESKILGGIQHLRFIGNEVIVFHVLDPFELEFPFQGLVQFDGFEGETAIRTRPMEIRKTYLEQMQAFRQRLIEGCERNSVHYVLTNTAHSLREVLSGYLAFRLRTS